MLQLNNLIEHGCLKKTILALALALVILLWTTMSNKQQPKVICFLSVTPEYSGVCCIEAGDQVGDIAKALHI